MVHSTESHGRSGALFWLMIRSPPIPPAADCFEPDRVIHIHEAAKFLGNSSRKAIDQIGETLQRPEVPFQVVPDRVSEASVSEEETP
jgi:hypothetical protein